MPINNSLPNKKFPMDLFPGEKPDTEFLSHLENIHIELLDYPSVARLLTYAPQMGLATWEARPHLPKVDEAMGFIHDMFSMKVLPTVLETIGLTFLISNIDTIDVTHLLRHRTMSFSAHCTGDRDQRHDSCLVKPSIEGSMFYSEYKALVRKSMQLYADMVDDGISILDARTILPKSMENHYYARVNLKDLLGYLHQRLDRQIQPESDNIVAMKMLIELVKVYPFEKPPIDLDAPDMWYVKTAQTDHSSNLYMPEKRNDIFDYKEQHFVYKKTRENMPGGQTFINIWNELRREYDTYCTSTEKG